MIPFNVEKASPDTVKQLLNEWETLHLNISEAHKWRNGSVNEFMFQGIELYNRLLVSTSDVKDFDTQDIPKYEVLPLNGEERYRFVLSKTEHYVSFIQLNELFDETKKKISRLRILASKI